MSDIEVLLKQLLVLELPQIMPGEVWIPSRPRRNLVEFRTPDGVPMRGQLISLVMRVEDLRNTIPGGHLDTGAVGWGDHLVSVSTAYLGFDLGSRTNETEPFVWESLFTVRDGPEISWRYKTKNAAHHGHARILEILGVPFDVDTLS